MSEVTTNKVCSRKGCDNPSRKANEADTCRQHHSEYMKEYIVGWRLAREGQTYLEPTNGYIYYYGKDHPIAHPSGKTRYHRMVLWNKINPEGDMNKAHACAECGEPVYWNIPYPQRDSLVVDHVDGNRANNDPSNLEPVHQHCNLKRGRDRKSDAA